VQQFVDERALGAVAFHLVLPEGAARQHEGIRERRATAIGRRVQKAHEHTIFRRRIEMVEIGFEVRIHFAREGHRSAFIEGKVTQPISVEPAGRAGVGILLHWPRHVPALHQAVGRARHLDPPFPKCGNANGWLAEFGQVPCKG